MSILKSVCLCTPLFVKSILLRNVALNLLLRSDVCICACVHYIQRSL